MRSLFFVLFILSGSCSLWLGGKFFLDLHDYFRKTSSTIAHVKKWEVEREKGGLFCIAATYDFSSKKKSYEKKMVFLKPCYPNRYLAEKQIDSWKEQQWLVWYDPQEESCCSLQRLFPVKKGVHFFLSCMVLLYFFYLHIYLAPLTQKGGNSS